VRNFLLAAAVCGGLGLAWARAAAQEVSYLDLQPKATQKLKDNLHAADSAGNNLTEVPTGEQTLEGIKFKIGEGLIQLGSEMVLDKPEKVEGIPVNKPFAKLHILHATGFSVAEDIQIGQYTIHYEDKTKETIPIVYGKDVRDWWYFDDTPGVTRGKVAWTGTNDFAKSNNAKIRLYLTTWTNPKPGMKVTSIDYSSSKTAAAPFCVAMTVEGK
jgi:hypothetical protein